jgi:hypothetical protein
MILTPTYRGPFPGRPALIGQPRYTTDEIVARGEALYNQQIRPQVEQEHYGKFLVLDIETGDYEIDRDSYAAYERAAARRPDGPFYLLRVGFPTAVTLGTESG